MHPSGITETKNYNINGYLNSVSAGGAVRWATAGMNALGQVTSGQYFNNIAATFGYDPYGNPTSTVAGTIQNYSYNFDPATGNLNWRQNNKYTGLKETFHYDNLDRLDDVYKGTTMTLDMAYDLTKGGITTKSDVGTLLYGNPGLPYAVSGINPKTTLTPAAAQTITYTSFGSVSTISQNNYSATFVYNTDNQRAQMVVKQGTSTILTRWYPTASYIKETAGSVTKEYTFIGGDAYTAPVAAVKQGTTTTYYDIMRDYLGNITHVVNASTKAVTAQYSFDAWGRMRNATTWAYYAPGSEPSLFLAGRGFTGHEHLPWFNVINMNGRVYDPLTGVFLSPDNYLQNTGFTQNYNRYAYCVNNPLKFSDPSGNKYDAMQSDQYGGDPDNLYSLSFLLAMEESHFRIFSQSFSSFGYGGRGGYHYDYSSGTYNDSRGNAVDYYSVYNNYILPNSYIVENPEKTVKRYQKEYASILYGISDYDALLSAGPGGSSTDDKHVKPNGNVISFSFDFAFAGGFGFEIGRVQDSYGSKKWFISGNVNIGYGLSAGFNYKEIYNANGYSFNINNYQGYAAGFSWGALIFGGETTGDKPSFEFNGFDKWGYKYTQESTSISILSAPKVGAWWTNSSTKFIWP